VEAWVLAKELKRDVKLEVDCRGIYVIGTLYFSKGFCNGMPCGKPKIWIVWQVAELTETDRVLHR
jgi:hypothetical protein